jgi:dipeptidyl aminopeptidase/acylaminoacyl peptidase
MRQLGRPLALMAATLALAAGVAARGPSAAAATGPGGLIAYSAWDENLNYDIYVMDPATPDAPPVRLSTDGRYNENPDWSPDGSKIVYDGWGTHFGPRIQVMDTDPATEDWTVLTNPCADEFDCYGDFQPVWSPDGTRIAFVSSRPNADGSENWSYEIYVMDATGEGGSLPPATRLTTDVPDPDTGASIEDSQVTWSPDGTRIAFLSEGRGADQDSCDLWAMDSQDLDGDGFGDNLRRLTFDESFNCDAFSDVSPQWAPNSNLIAFTSVRSGYFDIWLVNADDPTDLRNVTQTPDVYEDQPSWSSDGTQIIFRSSVSGAYEFYALPVPPPSGGSATAGAGAASAAPSATPPHPRQLTFDGKAKQQPDWGRVRRRPGTFTVSVSRRGRGHVRTDPAGIACGVDCTATFVARTTVRLLATAGPGYRFAGWRGDCAGTARTCSLLLDGSKRALARFVPTG